MRRSSAVLVLVLLLLAWTGGPAAAQRQGTPDAAAIAEARKLLLAMGAEKQFDAVINTMMRAMADLYRKQHPAHADAIADVFAKLTTKFMQRKSEALDLVAPLYAEKFTLTDMRDIAAFYASPTGQKLVELLPEITQRSVQLGMSWGQRIGQEVDAEARRELRQRGIPI